jgi:hypothetical protein
MSSTRFCILCGGQAEPITRPALYRVLVSQQLIKLKQG